jgi:hypothetical protein
MDQLTLSVTVVQRGIIKGQILNNVDNFEKHCNSTIYRNNFQNQNSYSTNRKNEQTRNMYKWHLVQQKLKTNSTLPICMTVIK